MVRSFKWLMSMIQFCIAFDEAIFYLYTVNWIHQITGQNNYKARLKCPNWTSWFRSTSAPFCCLCFRKSEQFLPLAKAFRPRVNQAKICVAEFDRKRRGNFGVQTMSICRRRFWDNQWVRLSWRLNWFSQAQVLVHILRYYSRRASHDKWTKIWV
jgi:hypothetical protein